MRRHVPSVFLGSLMIVGLSSATPAHAVCAAAFELPAVPIDEALARSDLAFVGTVTSTTPPDASSGAFGEIAFAVDDVWKGDAGKAITLRYQYSEDGDVQSATTGETWLIFATQGVAFGDCGYGSRRWTEDLAAFRPADAHRPSDRPRAWTLAAVLVGLAVVASASLVVIRRKRGADPTTA